MAHILSVADVGVTSKSQRIKGCARWGSLDGLTGDQLSFVDEVYALCEANYSAGGDVVVETMDPREVLAEFKSLKDVREYCGLKLDQASNCREGNDDDPEVKRLDDFDKGWRVAPG